MKGRFVPSYSSPLAAFNTPYPCFLPFNMAPNNNNHNNNHNQCVYEIIIMKW